MTVVQQSPKKLFDIDATGVRMLQLLGWRYLMCASNVAEITPTIEQVYADRMWECFRSPTFVADQRVRELERLDDGTYRATVQIHSESRAQREIILSAGAVLTCFIPSH